MPTDPLTEARAIVAAFRSAAPDLLLLMPDVVDVLTPTVTDDDHLGSTRTLALVAGGVQARRTRLTGREAENAARTVTGATFRFTLPLWVTLSERDVLRYDGRLYEVLAVTTGTYAAQQTVLTGDGRNR